MNLREDKHWSYGARSLLIDARGQRPFLVYAPVQSDKTKESMQEIARELNDILSTRPPTQDELDKIKKNRVLRLPGLWETMNAVAGSITQMVRFGLPDDYWNRYPDMIRSLNLQQIQSAAKTLLHPDKIVWLVVGDREKIESGIRDLGYGPIYFVDADGNLLQ